MSTVQSFLCLPSRLRFRFPSLSCLPEVILGPASEILPKFYNAPRIPRYPTLSTLLYAHFSPIFSFFSKRGLFCISFFSLCLSVCLPRCRCRPSSLPFSLSEWKPIKPNNIHIVLIIHLSHYYTPLLGPIPRYKYRTIDTYIHI
ncbi:hypothetical protein M413DRAFT_143659 [Hebeloma cylindrosporum]|uniref:Uncharacterized protein n=1 Tax=Hebeloma cylindrosporum TaxID=76867 RepID=A0A0C2XWM3_HEBCY|nr:hypothetical protein M413DRAFT_143659 [Hebeloma cylindrosporum h7]